MKVRSAEAGYDGRTAVTFLLAGLGIGTLIALFLTPRPMPGIIVRRTTKETRSPEEVASRN